MIEEALLANPWSTFVFTTLIAGLLGLLVHAISGPLLLKLARPMPAIQAMIRSVRPAAQWVLPIAAIQLAWQAFPSALPNIEVLRHFNGLLLIGTVTWLVLRGISGLTFGVIAQHRNNTEGNLRARQILTQARVLSRIAMSVVVVAGLAMMLMTFPGARHVGASLLASAGLFGIVAGLAAKPVFSNVIAGLQIALSQPIRIGDVLVVEGEWGRVEEVTSTFVALRIWDDRNLVLPLSYFIERPFENWTRKSSALTGQITFHVDYSTPVVELRSKARAIVQSAPEWDGRLCNLQVTDANERTLEVRILCTAADSSKLFDLRCRVREEIVAFVNNELPHCLPQTRTHPLGEAKA